MEHCFHPEAGVKELKIPSDARDLYIAVNYSEGLACLRDQKRHFKKQLNVLFADTLSAEVDPTASVKEAPPKGNPVKVKKEIMESKSLEPKSDTKKRKLFESTPVLSDKLVKQSQLGFKPLLSSK